MTVHVACADCGVVFSLPPKAVRRTTLCAECVIAREERDECEDAEARVERACVACGETFAARLRGVPQVRCAPCQRVDLIARKVDRARKPRDTPRTRRRCINCNRWFLSAANRMCGRCGAVAASRAWQGEA